MTGRSDKIWFRQGGLFAKYVISLVGLVVFVLAVHGGFEIWFSYRKTRATLSNAMSEKAEAMARRIEQSLSDLERQISSVTRASIRTLEERKTDYAQLLNQVPSVSQLLQLDGNGREQLRVSRTGVSIGSAEDFSQDLRFTQTVARGVTFAPAYFRGSEPFMSIAVTHAGRDAGVTVAEIDLALLSDFGDAQVGKADTAYVIDPRGVVLASPASGPRRGEDLSSLPQIAALSKSGGEAVESGTDADGQAVLADARPVPRVGWFVVFEQPLSPALTPIRELLLRIALLVVLGLLVAILAGTLLARRMLIPIRRCVTARGGLAPAISSIASTSRRRMNSRSWPRSSTAWPDSPGDLFGVRHQGGGTHPRAGAIGQ